MFQGWTPEYTGRIKLDVAERLIEAVKYFKSKGRKTMNPKESEKFKNRAREVFKKEKEKRLDYDRKKETFRKD